MTRYAGTLLSVTSLPSKYGIGCFDKAAYDFVDWLEKAGQRYWQILPTFGASAGNRLRATVRVAPTRKLRKYRVSSQNFRQVVFPSTV